MPETGNRNGDGTETGPLESGPPGADRANVGLKTRYPTEGELSSAGSAGLECLVCRSFEAGYIVMVEPCARGGSGRAH